MQKNRKKINKEQNIKKKIILLVTPNLNIQGGVTEFNKMLLKYSICSIKPFILSSAGKTKNNFKKQVLFIYDIIRYIIVLCSSIEIIHLGPSLGKNSVKRDGIYCWIGKLFNKKVYIHWHGWNPENEYLLEATHLSFVRKTMFKADHIKFLSNSFQEMFIKKGFLNKTSLGNTFVDDDLLKDFKFDNRTISKQVNILFLSTISVNKGIYTAIEIFLKLAQSNNVILTVAGDGCELENVKKSIPELLKNNVIFTGYISGKKKAEVFRNSDIYLFPSHYEGMPTSVLEAMSFGLPIVCSSVGALPDFFENEKMGYIIDKSDIKTFEYATKKLIENSSLRESIGKYNYKYATDHFLASKTIEKIDSDYFELIS